ncbi:hypothetical protein PVAP13_7NG389075 [Panicum virgatum]|uniref:Uncharacterized protein n=2 Tax=Panicum virgatum TaxID=38727 RepID=A0A8T0Q2F6_PANVG|nr:hypothetical protein PVAP13_7NG389075 [Panicum virgatum]
MNHLRSNKDIGKTKRARSRTHGGDRKARPVTNHDGRRTRGVWGSDRREDTGMWGGVEGGTRVGDPLGLTSGVHPMVLKDCASVAWSHPQGRSAAGWVERAGSRTARTGEQQRRAWPSAGAEDEGPPPARRAQRPGPAWRARQARQPEQRRERQRPASGPWARRRTRRARRRPQRRRRPGLRARRPEPARRARWQPVRRAWRRGRRQRRQRGSHPGAEEAPGRRPGTEEPRQIGPSKTTRPRPEQTGPRGRPGGVHAPSAPAEAAAGEGPAAVGAPSGVPCCWRSAQQGHTAAARVGPPRMAGSAPEASSAALEARQGRETAAAGAGARQAPWVAAAAVPSVSMAGRRASGADTAGPGGGGPGGSGAPPAGAVGEDPAGLAWVAAARPAAPACCAVSRARHGPAAAGARQVAADLAAPTAQAALAAAAPANPEAATPGQGRGGRRGRRAPGALGGDSSGAVRILRPQGRPRLRPQGIRGGRGTPIRGACA